MEEKSGLEAKVDPCNPPKKDYNRLLEKVRRDIAQHEKEVDENTNRLKALQEQRCTANFLFIEALKEHKIAIEIAGKLITMVGGYDFKSFV